MNSIRTPETYLAPCQTFKMEPFCKYRLQSDEQEQKALEFKIFNIVYYPVCYFISRCIIKNQGAFNSWLYFDLIFSLLWLLLLFSRLQVFHTNWKRKWCRIDWYHFYVVVVGIHVKKIKVTYDSVYFIFINLSVCFCGALFFIIEPYKLSALLQKQNLFKILYYS